MMHEIRKVRSLNVNHEQLITLATYDIKRAHEGNDLDLYDPLVMLFEYMKLDNLRVIDMFQFMDTKKRDKLSKKDIRNGLSVSMLKVYMLLYVKHFGLITTVTLLLFLLYLSILFSLI